MNKFILSAVCVSLVTLFTDPILCATGDLIKSFTVNGFTTVSLVEGNTVAFLCTKQDAVANPSWSIQALTSGEYIAGGGSSTFESASLSISQPAKCSYNGTIECRATSGTTTDSKSVSVTVACAATTMPAVTTTRNTGIAGSTQRNAGTAIVMKPTLLFSSAITAFCILFKIRLIV